MPKTEDANLAAERRVVEGRLAAPFADVPPNGDPREICPTCHGTGRLPLAEPEPVVCACGRSLDEGRCRCGYLPERCTCKPWRKRR
jgi:hypothetical protein